MPRSFLDHGYAGWRFPAATILFSCSRGFWAIRWPPRSSGFTLAVSDVKRCASRDFCQRCHPFWRCAETQLCSCDETAELLLMVSLLRRAKRFIPVLTLPEHFGLSHWVSMSSGSGWSVGSWWPPGVILGLWSHSSGSSECSPWVSSEPVSRQT